MANVQKGDMVGGDPTMATRKASSVEKAPARFGAFGANEGEVINQSQEFVEERRSALTKIVAGIGTLLGLSVLYPVSQFVVHPPKKKVEEKEKAVAKLDELPPGTGKTFQLGENRVFVLNVNGNLTAMSAVCTHLGCLVQWKPDENLVFCACHGARYTSKGEIVRGPQPAPLAPFGVRVENGEIIISKV